MINAPGKADQGVIWDFYKPRHTHSWNMLVLSWEALRDLSQDKEHSFLTEYHWENFIIRLWLYRACVRTLVKLPIVKVEANAAIARFDDTFRVSGRSDLKALRDMIEHFDDYAAGTGRGPADRNADLDPWRSFTKDHYERGNFRLDRHRSFEAANRLRSDAKAVSDRFIAWYRANGA